MRAGPFFSSSTSTDSTPMSSLCTVIFPISLPVLSDLASRASEKVATIGIAVAEWLRTWAKIADSSGFDAGCQIGASCN